jgi:hypothetical protein
VHTCNAASSSYKDLASPATCLCHCDQIRQIEQECTGSYMECNATQYSGTNQATCTSRLTERTRAISVAQLNWFSPPSSCPLVPGMGVTVTTTDGTHYMTGGVGPGPRLLLLGCYRTQHLSPRVNTLVTTLAHAKRPRLCRSTNSSTRCAGWQRYTGRHVMPKHRICRRCTHLFSCPARRCAEAGYLPSGCHAALALYKGLGGLATHLLKRERSEA